MNINSNILFIESLKEKFKQELFEEFQIIKDDEAKRRAERYSDHFGLLIDLLNEMYIKNYGNEEFDIVLKDTFTDIDHTQRNKVGNSGREISVRKINLIKIIEKEPS